MGVDHFTLEWNDDGEISVNGGPWRTASAPESFLRLEDERHRSENERLGETLADLADHIVDKIEYDTGRERASGVVGVYWPASEWAAIVRLLTPHQRPLRTAAASDETLRPEEGTDG